MVSSELSKTCVVILENNSTKNPHPNDTSLVKGVATNTSVHTLY